MQKKHAYMITGKPQALTAIRSYGEVAAAMAARGFPMSRARVHQLERRALAKLRTALAEFEKDLRS